MILDLLNENTSLLQGTDSHTNFIYVRFNSMSCSVAQCIDKKEENRKRTTLSSYKQMAVTMLAYGRDT